MAKKCGQGVICFENMTFALLFILVIMFFYMMMARGNTNKEGESTHEHTHSVSYNPFEIFFKPNIPYSNVPGDVYMNPYTAPMKDTRYMVPSHDIRGVPPNHHVQVPSGHQHQHGVPVNVPTQSIDTHYRQVGILTRQNGRDETILPLMGRPLFTSRDKWQYYSMSDKNNSVKLPLSSGGRSCTSEYGCNNLYNGDSVYIEGYNDAFKVTVYDNSPIQYIPYL